MVGSKCCDGAMSAGDELAIMVDAIRARFGSHGGEVVAEQIRIGKGEGLAIWQAIRDRMTTR